MTLGPSGSSFLLGFDPLSLLFASAGPSDWAARSAFSCRACRVEATVFDADCT